MLAALRSRRMAALTLLLATAAGGGACGDDDDDGTGPTATVYTATLSGANERPTPVTTSATGRATITVTGQQAQYEVTFSGLSGAPTGAHIHGPASSAVAAPVLVPFSTAGVTTNGGTLTGTFTAANILAPSGQPAPISFDSLVTLMRTGNAYVNVHTAANAPGEIRGQLGPRP